MIRRIIAAPFIIVGGFTWMCGLAIRHGLDKATQMVDGFTDIVIKVKGE